MHVSPHALPVRQTLQQPNVSDAAHPLTTAAPDPLMTSTESATGTTRSIQRTLTFEEIGSGSRRLEGA
jgi:hypothetical protein